MTWNPTDTTTGQVVTSAFWNAQIGDHLDLILPNGMTTVDWDPTLEATTTTPSVSVDGARCQIGPIEILWARFTFSAIATPQGSGIYFVNLANSAANILSSITGGAGQIIGVWQGRDDSASAAAHGTVLLRSAASLHFNTTGTGLVTDTSPFAPSWGGNDVLSFLAVVPTA